MLGYIEKKYYEYYAKQQIHLIHKHLNPGVTNSLNPDKHYHGAILNSRVEKETITRVAIKPKHQRGLVFSVAKPGHHAEVIAYINWLFRDSDTSYNDLTWTQGFVTSTGRFVNRKEALKLAYNANQLIEIPPTKELYSEFMWHVTDEIPEFRRFYFNRIGKTLSYIKTFIFRIGLMIDKLKRK